MNEYKQQIIDFYDGRDDYDNEFTRNRALSLLDLVPQFSIEIAKLATSKGVWDESMMFLVSGQK